MFIVPLSSAPSLFPTEQKGSTAKTALSGSSFGEMFGNAVKNLEETQKISDKDSMELAMGNADDLHTIQINSMRATAAVELTASVTSKAISAYKEITGMQI